MDCNFNDNEFVIRAVLPPEMRPKFWKNGKLKPSALKDKRGLSVDRTYDKSIDFIINHMRKNKGLIGLMVYFTMTDCKYAEALLLYKPSSEDIYHCEIHGSEDSVVLSPTQTYILARRAVLQGENTNATTTVISN